MNFTPCQRCSGAGWFREYKHVQGGICFRCNGQRYEELIQKNEVNLDEYLTSDEYSFDLINPLDNINENIVLFNKGKDLYWDYYWNSEKDKSKIEKAFQLLLKSALNGFGEAQNYCGLILYKQRSYRRSLRWFAYSAMHGVLQAQNNLYTYFSAKESTITYNLELANKWKDLANAKIKGPIDDEHTFHEPVEGTLAYEDYMSFLEDKGKEMTWFYESQETLHTWTLKEFLRHCGAVKTVRLFEAAYYHPLTQGGENTISFYVGNKRIDIFNYQNNYPVKYVAEHPEEFCVEQQKSGYYYLWKVNKT